MRPVRAGMLAIAALLGQTVGAYAGGAIPADEPTAPAPQVERLSRLYLDIYGGVGWTGDNALDTGEVADGPVLQTFFLDYDEDFVGGLRLGHRYSDRLRVDAEYAYRRSELGELTSPGNIITPGNSFTFTTQALMLNGYYDFAQMGAITPYVGVGIGAASVKAAGSIAPGDPSFDYSSRQSAFAAQFRIGASYAMSETMDLGLEYTHFRAFGIDENLSADFYDTIRNDYTSDSLAVVVRLKF